MENIQLYVWFGVAIVLLLAIILSARKLAKSDGRIETWKVFGLLILGLSPVGIVIPYLGIAGLGLCEGETFPYGTYHTMCYVPFGEYLAVIGSTFTGTFLIGVGIFWLVAAAWVWFALLVRLLALVLRRTSKP